MKRTIIIEVPLAGPDNRWHELCRCDSPASAAEVVRILTSIQPVPVTRIQLTVLTETV